MHRTPSSRQDQRRRLTPAIRSPAPPPNPSPASDPLSSLYPLLKAEAPR
jgi:hypothetical protein